MHGMATSATKTSERYIAPAHRRDIDGLRALAILPVLLFHAHVPGFSGGYVGVDIFFVISGFLITGIIAREVDAGRFSIVGFYERRFRRIMPALSVMILVVLGLSAWLYLPGDLEGVPKSALAATLFASNLWFFTDTGYFAGGADVKPLLHTWSLAVEEQFYIGFPILLLLVTRFAPKWRTAIIWAIAGASLALCIAMRRDATGFAFYLLPTRGWELLAGGLLALGEIAPVRRKLLREGIACAGLAAILYAVTCFDKDTLFPGSAALLPVLGAAALIHTAPETRVGRLLGEAPLVGIGLISYSLYLWHWPFIVLAEYATDLPLRGPLQLLVLVGSSVAAWLSWRFVERPFRDRSRVPAPRIFAFTGISIAVLCGLSAALIHAGPWPSRFSPAVLAQMAGRDDISPERGRCHDSFMRHAQPCVLGAAVKPSAMLWGDSHGVEMAYALSELLEAKGGAIIERTTSSCPPVLGYQAKDIRCVQANDSAMKALRDDPAIRTVYLAAFWANGDFDTPAFVAQLDETIRAIRGLGRAVVIIGPVPPQPFDVPRHLAHLAQRGDLRDAHGVERRWVNDRTIYLRASFDQWQRQGVKLIDPIARLCGPQWCAIERNGRPLYFDSHHLSVTGARLVIDR